MRNSPNLTILHNEVEIIDFLVDNNAMINDFSKSHFHWSFIGENFQIILFLAEGDKPRFECYIVERFSENMNDMINLWNTFDYSIKANEEVRIMKLAKNKVHDLIAMSETFRAFFHRNELDEE